MVVFAIAVHFIVSAVERICQLFMYFSFLVVPNGQGEREHRVEAVKERVLFTPMDSILAQEVFPSTSVRPLWE